VGGGMELGVYSTSKLLVLNNVSLLFVWFSNYEISLSSRTEVPLFVVTAVQPQPATSIIL
jgi:hypothetical protein